MIWYGGEIVSKRRRLKRIERMIFMMKANTTGLMMVGWMMTIRSNHIGDTSEVDSTLQARQTCTPSLMWLSLEWSKPFSQTLFLIPKIPNLMILEDWTFWVEFISEYLKIYIVMKMIQQDLSLISKLTQEPLLTKTKLTRLKTTRFLLKLTIIIINL